MLRTSVGTFEKGYLIVCIALFGYAILQWRGVAGDAHSYRPVAFIALTGAMLLQATAPFVRQRSRTTYYALLAASLVGLVWSVVAR